MAEVWLARRADGAFKREVALKLPMLQSPASGLEARFARERDILAESRAPHIARLYDAGDGPQGLPYLAMEYVQGRAADGLVRRTLARDTRAPRAFSAGARGRAVRP